MPSELLARCDGEGRALGATPRELCHGNPALIHMTVHLHVVDPRGRLFLQKRAGTKDLHPGKWDTSVGGHVAAGEAPGAALAREAREELGIDAAGATPLYRYLHANSHESEFVHTFVLRLEGPFRLDPEEIEEGRFFSRPEIEAWIGTGALTPNFEEEYARLCGSGCLDPCRA